MPDNQENNRISIYVQRPKRKVSKDELNKYPESFEDVCYTGHAYIGLCDKESNKEVFYDLGPYTQVDAVVAPVAGGVVERTDKQREYMDRIDYPVSDKQFNAAKKYAEEKYESGSNYSLIGFNCIDFVAKIAQQADLEIPSKGLLISRPVIMSKNIVKMEKEYKAIMAEFNKASYEINATFSHDKKSPVAEKDVSKKQEISMPELLELDIKTQEATVKEKTPVAEKWDVSKKGIPVSFASRLKQCGRG